MRVQGQATHLDEGHDEPNLVPALVELGAHAQAGGGARVADQSHHGLEGGRCCMKTRCGWGGLARTFRDASQEPHYRDAVEGSSHV